MNTKSIIYLASAFALMGAATSCEQNDIYENLEFSVHLAPGNTYLAGEPVVFDFGGNADFITVWNGDTGHEYRFRDRTTVSIDDIESCELEIKLHQRYGDAKPEVSNLDILASDGFAGLAGDDATADRTIVEAIAANDAADWERLAYTPNRLDRPETYTFDITHLAGNFSLGLHFHHDAAKNMRTYYINPKITVKFKGYDTQVYNYSAMEFVPFSMASQHVVDPYIHNVSGNGNVKFAGRPGANSSGDIVFQGFNTGQMDPIDQWVFMQPIALNSISPDKGANIKGVADDVRRYEHTYTTPGTYTATFIVSTGNYQGASAREVREVSFTIVDPIR